jgi:hypothetical protein
MEGYSREIEWSLTRNTKELFLSLMDELELYDEGTDDYETVQDQIRSLPGHPMNTTRDDFIWLVVTDFQVGS